MSDSEKMATRFPLVFIIGASDHQIDCSKYAMGLDAYTARFECNFVVSDLDQRHNTTKAPCNDHPAWKWLRGIGSVRIIAHLAPLRRTLRSRSGTRRDARRTLTKEEKTWVLSGLESDPERLRAICDVDPKATWGIDPERSRG